MLKLQGHSCLRDFMAPVCIYGHTLHEYFLKKCKKQFVQKYETFYARQLPNNKLILNVLNDRNGIYLHDESVESAPFRSSRQYEMVIEFMIKVCEILPDTATL